MEDEEMTLMLPLRQWRVIAAHVEGGIYRDVQPILESLYAQVNAQITAANERAATVAAEIKAATACGVVQSESTDDLSEPQLISQPMALH